jgi:predicted enzyme related to lactoylglutathione lyase
VDDVDATARRAGELGGRVLVGPQDIPGVGRFAVVKDPQGATITFITYEKR